MLIYKQQRFFKACYNWFAKVRKSIHIIIYIGKLPKTIIRNSDILSTKWKEELDLHGLNL